jgi:uncharacterized protein (DUF2126 family)
MDRSGNTHRAEISVDKLWNPFAPTAVSASSNFAPSRSHPARCRLLRHRRCFVRAILARLAADPFKTPFVRWAGELHDRFFLPSFVWEDLAKICADLAAHNIPFDPEWLRPAWEFRFPKLGEFALAIQPPADPENPKAEKPKPIPFTVEFRQALEAWPLLGESPNAGTVSRSVDSSLDRLEARVSDVTALETGLLLVNGLPCEFRPLSPSTSTSPTSIADSGGAAAGIRYRAFYLTPSLQPHVPVHAPLLLEWVDRETLTVVAAAKWHVWNPTNAQYPAAPANDAEAATRRAERWQPLAAHRRPKPLHPENRLPPRGPTHPRPPPLPRASEVRRRFSPPSQSVRLFLNDDVL